MKFEKLQRIDLNGFFLWLIVIPVLLFGCKKDSGPPPEDDTIWLKGHLLSYYDDSPLSNATLKLYYTNSTPSTPDEIVTTDSNGFFNYRQVKDTGVTAIPSLSGWWCPFEYGYQLNYPGDAFENDSIIYLFHQQTVKVNLHFDSPPTFPETGKYSIGSLAKLSKLDSVGDFLLDEHLKTYTDTGNYVYFLSAIDGINNALWFKHEVVNLFSGASYYSIMDTIGFVADTTAGPLVFDFYH